VRGHRTLYTSDTTSLPTVSHNLRLVFSFVLSFVLSSFLLRFSCKAEGGSYAIKGPETPYSNTTQQLLRRAYYAAVSFTDSHIGALLASLDDSGKANETIVVIHADHGYVECEMRDVR
jgi:hypothetical protein